MLLKDLQVDRNHSAPIGAFPDEDRSPRGYPSSEVPNGTVAGGVEDRIQEAEGTTVEG